MAKDIKQRKAYAYLHGLSDSVPISVIKKWNRHNFDKGMFLALKKAKIERILKREMNNELNICNG